MKIGSSNPGQLHRGATALGQSAVSKLLPTALDRQAAGAILTAEPATARGRFGKSAGLAEAAFLTRNLVSQSASVTGAPR